MIETISNTQLNEKIHEESFRFQLLNTEIAKIIIGNQETVKFILIALLCDGHILLEGVPGVAKTTLVKTITKALGLGFSRIQFTPDLLPADIIGTLIYNPQTQTFETRKGPIFANLILADEINRAPAKVQAALLEAMQEKQVTIGSHTYHLDRPFLVFATQNPIEQEGTYQLPEAQIDRFMFKLIMGYPTIQEERSILTRSLDVPTINQILTINDIINAQQIVHATYTDDKIIEYIVNLVYATRNPALFNLMDIEQFIKFGASPRATLALHHAAKAHAFLKKRHFVTPDDVKAVCAAVLRHRITLSYHAQADDIKPDDIINKILAKVPCP